MNLPFDYSVLLFKLPQQRIKSAFTSLSVAEHIEVFVEIDGKCGTMKRVGNDKGGIAEIREPQFY